MRTLLDGLAIGDAFGDRFFFDQRPYQQDVWQIPAAQRPLPHSPWLYSDDTQMALSIAQVLARVGTIDQDVLAQSFADHFERSRGYRPAMYELLPRIRAGRSWRTAALQLFSGSWSFGNGGTMRIAPLGAYFPA